jgi:hypothetical protein
VRYIVLLVLFCLVGFAFSRLQNDEPNFLDTTLPKSEVFLGLEGNEKLSAPVAELRPSIVNRPNRESNALMLAEYPTHGSGLRTLEEFVKADFETRSDYLLRQIKGGKAYLERNAGSDSKLSESELKLYAAHLKLSCARADVMFSELATEDFLAPHKSYCGSKFVSNSEVAAAIAIVVENDALGENEGSATEANAAQLVMDFIPKVQMSQKQKSLVERVLHERAKHISDAGDFEAIVSFLRYYEDEPSKQMSGYLHLLALDPNSSQLIATDRDHGFYAFDELYTFLADQGHELANQLSSEEYTAAFEYQQEFFPNLTEEVAHDYSSWIRDD